MLVYQRVTNQHRPTMYRTSSSHVVLLGTRPSAAKVILARSPRQLGQAWGVSGDAPIAGWFTMENPMKIL